MRKDVADMWVAALRSGEYAQTRQFLRKGGGFCCLGVLCDLHQRHTQAGEWRDHEDGLESAYVCSLDAYNYSRTCLPEDVYAWAECFADPGASVLGVPLASLNDDQCYTFAQLADVIEKHWEDL